MNKIPVPLIWFALAVAVVGGISRLTGIPFIVESRVFAGTAIVMLLAAIAINTLPRER